MMRIPRLALLALLFAPAPSSAQLPVIVLANDPMVQEDRVGVNHFITALRALDVDVVEYLDAGEVALEVVVQYVRRADRQFHVVVMAISYVRRLPDKGESRTRPALAVNSGSGEVENLIRGMAEDVFHFLDQSGDRSDPFDDRGGLQEGGDQLSSDIASPLPPVVVGSAAHPREGSCRISAAPAPSSRPGQGPASRSRSP